MATISQYSTMKNNAKNAISTISELRSDLNNLLEQFEEGIIINGKVFDDGVIAGCLAQLLYISNNYLVIVNYCNRKIEELRQQQMEINRKRREISIDSAAGGPKIFDDRKLTF